MSQKKKSLKPITWAFRERRVMGEELLGVLRCFMPDAFALWVREVSKAGALREVYNDLGVKYGRGISRTRALGNLCERVHGKEKRDEYLAALLEVRWKGDE